MSARERSQKKGAAAAKVAKGSSKALPRPARAKDPAKVAAGKAGAPKKGERRGGRKRGTPNKRTLELRELLEAAGLDGGTHPIVMMYRVYTGELTMPVVVRMSDGDETWNEVQDVPLEPALRVKCMAEVAQYLEPKRKAVEVANASAEAGVAFCFKQWGTWRHYVGPGAGRLNAEELAHRMAGPDDKSKGGRLLDGVLHDALPWVQG